MLQSPLLMLALCWVLYVAVHSIMAAVWFKQAMQKLMGRRYAYYRLLYSCIAAITLGALLVFQFGITSPLLFQPLPVVTALAGLLGIAGLAVMAACIGKYFINLSGVDVLMKQKREPVLETGGLHRWVRHPLYAGTLLFIWSLFLLFPYLHHLVACAIITVYTLIGISIEEKKLLLEFGQQYAAYAGRTPMLIPFTTIGKR